MKELYLAIIEVFKKEGIKDLYRQQGITPIKHINLYFGQEFEESTDVYNKPALFLRWQIDYTTTPAIATLTFKIVYENLRDTSSNGHSNDKSLKFIDLIDLTDKILKSIETKYTSKLLLITEEFNAEPSVLDYQTLTYNCNYTKKESGIINEFLIGKIEQTPIDSALFQKLK